MNVWNEHLEEFRKLNLSGNNFDRCKTCKLTLEKCSPEQVFFFLKDFSDKTRLFVTIVA